MNNTSGQFMPMPKATVAITTQSSLSKEQNCVTIDFFVISSVMLVNNFLSKKNRKSLHNHFAENKTQLPCCNKFMHSKDLGNLFDHCKSGCASDQCHEWDTMHKKSSNFVQFPVLCPKLFYPSFAKS